MHSRTVAVVSVGLTLLSASALRAVDYPFAGPINGNWNTAGNWDFWNGSEIADTLTLPGPSDHAIMDSTTAMFTTGSTTVSKLSIARFNGNNGALRVTGGMLSVTTEVHVGEQGNGALYLDGGTLNVGGNFRLSAGETLNQTQTSNLEVTGGVLNITGGLEVPALAWTDTTRDASIQLLGGTINAGSFSLKAFDNTFGSLNITEGTLHINQGPGAGSFRLIELQQWVTDGHITAYGVQSDPTQNYIVITSDASNIWVTAQAVPEPTGLAGLALAGVLMLRRRQAR